MLDNTESMQSAVNVLPPWSYQVDWVPLGLAEKGLKATLKRAFSRRLPFYFSIAAVKGLAKTRSLDRTLSSPDSATCMLEVLGKPQFPHQQNGYDGYAHLAKLL